MTSSLLLGWMGEERKKLSRIPEHKSTHNGLAETKLNYFKLFPSFRIRYNF